MITPETRVEPPAEESSSLTRWLVVAAIIVLLAVGATFAVRWLPAEGLPGEDSLIARPEKRNGPPGKVVLSEDSTYKFDVMPTYTKGRHTWIFKNEGQGELDLWKGASTCSCTIANFPTGKKALTLKPGTSTEITLEWETRNFDGKYQKSADIHVIGDPDRDKITFAVEGTIRPALVVEPRERVLTFGTFPNDQSRFDQFVIGSADKPDFKILSLTSSNEKEIGLSFVPLPDDIRKSVDWMKMKGGYLVKVEIKPSRSLGPFSEEITVTTDHPKVAEAKVTVTGKRDGPISVFPESVTKHDVQPEEGVVLTVMITVRDATDTAFTVEDAPKSLKVEVTPADVKTGSGAKVRRYRMTVTVPPDTPSGIIGGTIVLKTDNPVVDHLRVPVDLIVLGGN